MNNPADNRRLVCEFTIVIVACAGAHSFLGALPRAGAAGVRSQIADLERKQAAEAGVGSLSDSQVEILERTTAERAERIRGKSAPALDEATMFARVSELAAASALRLEHLNPVQSAQPGAPTAPSAPQLPVPAPGTPAAQGAALPPAPQPITDRRIGYSIAVTGSYSDLAAFIGALTDRLGYTVIKSVTITQPDLKKPDALRAVIETEHVALDLSAIDIGPVAATRQPMPIAPAPPSFHPTDPSHDSDQE